MVFTYVVNISDIVEFSQVSSLFGNVSKERQERIARFRYDKDKIRYSDYTYIQDPGERGVSTERKQYMGYTDREFFRQADIH